MFRRFFAMFKKIDFANMLKRINSLYENQTYFANVSGVNRTYLSQYMNLKLDTPPSPKILKGIAEASKGTITYDNLMEVCGYLDLTEIYMHPVDKTVNCIPLLYDFDYSKPDLYNEDYIIDYIPFTVDDNIENYFAYQVPDNSMLPLLDIGDIAIIYKQNDYEYGKTYLLIVNDNLVCIRKILLKEDIIELHAMNPYYPIMKLANKDFKVIGRVIKAENKSAFK